MDAYNNMNYDANDTNDKMDKCLQQKHNPIWDHINCSVLFYTAFHISLQWRVSFGKYGSRKDMDTSHRLLPLYVSLWCFSVPLVQLELNLKLLQLKETYPEPFLWCSSLQQMQFYKARIPRRRHRQRLHLPDTPTSLRPTRAIFWSYSCGKLNDTPTFSRHPREDVGEDDGVLSVSASWND